MQTEEAVSVDPDRVWETPVLEALGKMDNVAATSNHVNTDGLGGRGLS